MKIVELPEPAVHYIHLAAPIEADTPGYTVCRRRIDGRSFQTVYARDAARVTCPGCTGDPTVHAVNEFADGEREPLCGAPMCDQVDAYEDDWTPFRPATCGDCIREMKSRGWQAY